MAAGQQLAVVAVGGNSLIADETRVSIPYQSETAAETAHEIAEILSRGWNVVVTHGNGPQVGFILRRSEIGQHEVPPIPMNYATSNTQGSIGYMFQRSLDNELRRRGSPRRAVAVITQTLVDREHPAFDDPTKPIGPHMDESTARRHAAEQGWIVKEDAGRGWRRVVPSPPPLRILEVEAIRDLIGAGHVVIACGGGGLPVVEDEAGDLHGVEAVVDKDHASSLLARELGAELLLISTAVDRVSVHFNQPGQRWLDRLTVAEARAYATAGHFAAGSMGPKVEAILDFVEASGGRGVISDPAHLVGALTGDAGTTIVPSV
jgi:carbamate kinase